MAQERRETAHKNKASSNTQGARPNVAYGNMLDQMRYIEVLSKIKDRHVLDIACGVGWGSYLMSKAGAKSVTGVDLSHEALESARKFYSTSNTRYLLGDGNTIPCEENSFDVIVSMETIEHVEDPARFVKELMRVGKPHAELFLSTPNGRCTKWDNGDTPKNPFHYNEYSRKELESILEGSWAVEKYLGQVPLRMGSTDVARYRKFLNDYWR